MQLNNKYSSPMTNIFKYLQLCRVQAVFRLLQIPLIHNELVPTIVLKYKQIALLNTILIRNDN